MTKRGYRLMPRDKAIFRALYACRVLTSTQIAAKFYLNEYGEPRNDVLTSADASPKCRQRLMQLTDNGYLYREDLPTKKKEGTKPYVYFLDKGAAEELAQEAGVPLSKFGWRPRDNELSESHTLPHLIALNDVRISMEVDAAQRGIQILAWETEQALAARSMRVALEKDGVEQEHQLIPDSYFCLYTRATAASEGEGCSYAYFLEIDMGTEHAPLATDRYSSNYFTTKVVKYLSYFALQQQQQDFGFAAIRVLTVTPDPQRLEKLLQATENKGGRLHFWFTTFADIVPIQSALTKPIWWQAGNREKRTLIW